MPTRISVSVTPTSLEAAPPPGRAAATAVPGAGVVAPALADPPVDRHLHCSPRRRSIRRLRSDRLRRHRPRTGCADGLRGDLRLAARRDEQAGEYDPSDDREHDPVRQTGCAPSPSLPPTSDV